MNNHDRGQVVATAAEIYDQFFVPALFAEWPARVLKAAHVQTGDKILDVACGTGILARTAVSLIGSQGAVVGIDINEGMLAIAQKKAPQISWKIAPAESLPFDNGTFDRVVSQFGLMFFTDQVKAITEMKRVLRPGGSLAVAVWDRLDKTPGYATVAQILEALFGQEVANSIEAPYNLGDKQRLTSLFAAAGIENMTIQTITGQARFSSVDSWIYTDIKGWTLADVISDEEYETLREIAPDRLSQFVQVDGSVAFDAPAHIVTWSAGS